MLNLKKMKKTLSLLLILVFMGCNGQDKKEKQAKDDDKNVTVVKPKTRWDVKKEYDEYGNLIKYDSIYSWSYSTKDGDSLKVNLDSIMDTFKMYFGDKMPFERTDDFFYFPSNDSLLMSDFFKNDYFFRNWQKQHPDIEEIVKQMDSLRNDYLKKFHPGLMESIKKD